MSTATAEKQLTNQQQPPAKAFRALATRMATDLLTDWVGKDRAGEAVGRISAALSSAAASAKKPEDFYSCTPASIANCVAISALTGIMPGTGSTALAYLIPRSPRKGEQKQLGFSFSHRGLNALAGRSGQIMIAIPISKQDSVSVNGDGEVIVEHIAFDDPPTEYEELRGVLIIVRRIETGIVVCRGWMPRKLIDKRRDDSDSYSFAIKPGKEWAKESDPWHKWPVEMAMKTAMHYAVSRGWCVIDDASSVRALANDASSNPVVIDSHVVEKPATLNDLAERMLPQPQEANETEQENTEETAEEQETEADPISPAIADLRSRLALAKDEKALKEISAAWMKQTGIDPETFDEGVTLIEEAMG